MASAILGGGAAYATMRGRRAHATSRAFAAAAIVLCALLTASVGFNIYQYVDHSNERQARLEDTLLRQARTPGGLPSDPEVKELSYAQQTKHADAMSTAQAESLLEAAERGESKDVVFLDVRERAEREMGTLRGVTFVRYPDFAASGLNLKGKQAVLFCHNGNRSHETCEALKKQGIDCRFIVGGVEKWVTEGRAMEGLRTRSLYQLRAIPEYRNRNTLLDTHEVRRLVAEEKAIFVDARYPFEFENNGRLPNAINFTIRRTPTADLQKHIDALPKQPIILPCYDRRTCFFSEVLGLELTRAGLDVRGRYTQPWAYFVQSPRPPHVEQWIAENNRSIWAKSASHLANFLAWLSQWTGLILVIVLLAAVSRLLVLPFSLKAERDQIRSRATGSELDVIKRDLKDDPVRRTRAIWGFYKRHNLTPMRNLLALLFLPVMAVALLAVQEMSEKSDIALLWMPSIAQRDPWVILPLVFGVLITLYSDLAFATNAKHRIVIWLTVLPLMSATGALFSAGPNLYLIASAALLLVQRLWVDGSMARAMQQLRRSRLPMGVIALEDVSKLADYGNKAHRLAQMRAAGMPIPDGLLLTPDFLKSFADSSTQQQTKLLDRLWNRLGRHHLAVRSSANGEDSASQSFAGVFESVLDVDRTGLSKAIATVQGSYKAARVGAYASNTGDGSVLMQRMVHAQYSGVLFTRDPSAGGLAMVEMVQGTAENLVSGLVRPQTYRFGRLTKKSFSHEDPQIDLAPLLALGDQAEVLFGGPQDIEWTYRGGQFYLVQCRDITRSIAGDAVEAALQQDIARVVEIAKGAPADEIIFGKNELSEMLPRPTPLSLSLMESLWASGGSVDRAARELQLTYQVEEGSEYFATILGRLYVDKREEKSRALVLPSRAIKRLFRQADKIERDFHEIFLPEFLGSARLVSVADFEKLSADELVSDIGRLRDRFVNDTHVAVDVINIAASIYLDRARAALVSAKIDPSDVLGHIPETIESRSIMEIAATRDRSRQKFLMLRNFGHRAVFEYELAGPRFSENPDALGRLIAGREPTTHKSDRESPKLAKSLARMIDVARRFQTLKEDAKHHSLRELATLRRAVLCLDRRFGLEGASFYLSFDELLTLNAQNAAVLRVIANNRQEHAALLRKSSSLPAKLRSHDLEAASAGELVQAQASTDAIRGTRVAGSKVVEARAWVISDDDSEQAKSMEGFHDGDIIVSVMINPAWLPYFSRAGGFVSEVGGWLSHPAILAREYDVAMIVGVDGLSRISDGSLLRLQLDGSIVIVAEGRKVEEVQAA